MVVSMWLCVFMCMFGLLLSMWDMVLIEMFVIVVIFLI